MAWTHIPTAAELSDRLNGLDALLTARNWERAAIVYAFTGVGGPRNSKQPPPPKMNIRTFARQGFAGLTTNKSVEHYRGAWVLAIRQGWARPAEPGQDVELPGHPFPSWPTKGEKVERTWRPLVERLFGQLDQAATAVHRLTVVLPMSDLDDGVRDQLRARLNALRAEADTALDALGHRVAITA